MDDQHESRDWDPQDRFGLPTASTRGRSVENPYPLRMFAETGCDFALLGPPRRESAPTSSGIDGALTLEERLPISAGLRERLLRWGYDFDVVGMDGEEHDTRGYDLSRELQQELGELYSVEYSLSCEGPHRRALRARAQAEPLRGWTLKD